jgi:hypothetical protein
MTVRTMFSRSVSLLAAAVLAAPLLLAQAGSASADGAAKPKKPRLDLRATPRMGFSPVHVLFTAELLGGDDVEEFHCPEIEWEWDDGGKTIREADCAPFEPGTSIQRRFTAEHTFRRANVYRVKATMRRNNKTLAAASVNVTVRAGLGDPTMSQ